MFSTCQIQPGSVGHFKGPTKKYMKILSKPHKKADALNLLVILHQKEFHPSVQGKSFSSLRIHTQSPSDIMWLEHKVMHCVAHNIDPRARP